MTRQAPPVSDAARQWIADNLARGADPGSIRAAMEAQGLDGEFAASAIAQVQGALGATVYDDESPWRLPAGPMLDGGDRRVAVQLRASRPRIVLLAEVMTPAECEALITLARPRLAPSTVIDPATGADVVARYRASEGVFFRLGETPLVALLDARLSKLVGQPIEHGEGLQVLRYEAGGASETHVDWLHDDTEAGRSSIARSGQRIATLLVYLNDVAAGGATTFPHPDLEVIPRRGQGLYFEYCDGQGRCDPRSAHGGAPVLAGEKWVVTKWLRQRRFQARSS